ncbi:MAG TPA: M67 family metallopeptidase [Anaerolineales bacterium]|nr:M67 family metallopeptidase [Anaerolineales bacterium]
MDQLTGPMQESIQLTMGQWDIMREDANQRFPEEACGLLLGKAGKVFSVVPVTNILHSRVRYRMDPQEQFSAFSTCEKNGWDLTAIYHSHPDGLENPSKTDIDECYYPEAIYLIWYKKDSDWQCKGFTIRADSVSPVPVKILPG